MQFSLDDYLALQTAGVPVKHVTRHAGAFPGSRGARWRRYISQHAHLDAGNHRLLAGPHRRDAGGMVQHRFMAMH